MGNKVEVSWQGMQQLIGRTHEQYLNLSEVSGFASSAGLGNTGAFSGVLGLFRGSYESALSTVNESLTTSLMGARDLSEAIADARDDFRTQDEGVSMLSTQLETQVEDGPVYEPPASDGVPQVNDHVVNVNDLADHEWHAPGPRPPGWVPAANINSPLGLVDTTASMADNANGTGSAMGHDDDFDDFIDRHPKR